MCHTTSALPYFGKRVSSYCLTSTLHRAASFLWRIRLRSPWSPRPWEVSPRWLSMATLVIWWHRVMSKRWQTLLCVFYKTRSYAGSMALMASGRLRRNVPRASWLSKRSLCITLPYTVDRRAAERGDPRGHRRIRPCGEGLWQQLKGVELCNVCCLNLPHLRHELRDAVKRVRRKPRPIKSFFRGAQL